MTCCSAPARWPRRLCAHSVMVSAPICSPDTSCKSALCWAWKHRVSWQWSRGFFASSTWRSLCWVWWLAASLQSWKVLYLSGYGTDRVSTALFRYWLRETRGSFFSGKSRGCRCRRLLRTNTSRATRKLCAVPSAVCAPLKWPLGAGSMPTIVWTWRSRSALQRSCNTPETTCSATLGILTGKPYVLSPFAQALFLRWTWTLC